LVDNIGDQYYPASFSIVKSEFEVKFEAYRYLNQISVADIIGHLLSFEKSEFEVKFETYRYLKSHIGR